LPVLSKEVDSKMIERVTPDIIDSIVKLIPDAWLVGDSPFGESNQHRDAYLEYLLSRLDPRMFSWRRRSVRDHYTYDYAIIRVIPRVEREEFVNVGVIVSCSAKGFSKPHSTG
jgi:hypothetical protein